MFKGKFPILFFALLLIASCRNNCEVKKIVVYKVGAIDKPFHHIILSDEHLEMDSSIMDFNFTLTKELMMKMHTYCNTLPKDTTALTGGRSAFMVSYQNMSGQICEEKQISNKTTNQLHEYLITSFQNEIASDSSRIEKIKYLNQRLREEGF